MIPPAFEPAPSLAVVAQTCGLLEARVTQFASRSFNHFFGQVSGNTARYGDIGAFAWYATRSGFDTRGAHRRQLRRYPSGLEDSDNLKRSG